MKISVYNKKVVYLLKLYKKEKWYLTSKVFGSSQVKMHQICLENKNCSVSLPLPITKCYL